MLTFFQPEPEIIHGLEKLFGKFNFAPWKHAVHIAKRTKSGRSVKIIHPLGDFVSREDSLAIKTPRVFAVLDPFFVISAVGMDVLEIVFVK